MFGEDAVRAQAEEDCCFGYSEIVEKMLYIIGIPFWPYWETTCNTEGLHVSVRAAAANGIDDNVNDDPGNVVDVLWGPEPTRSGHDIALCMFCTMHASCSDNEVPGANLTMFDTCTETGCCAALEE